MVPPLRAPTAPFICRPQTFSSGVRWSYHHSSARCRFVASVAACTIAARLLDVVYTDQRARECPSLIHAPVLLFDYLHFGGWEIGLCGVFFTFSVRNGFPVQSAVSPRSRRRRRVFMNETSRTTPLQLPTPMAPLMRKHARGASSRRGVIQRRVSLIAQPTSTPNADPRRRHPTRQISGCGLSRDLSRKKLITEICSNHSGAP